MKVYIDLVFIVNFLIDFLLLLTVNYILKRNASLKKIFFGGIVGALSIFLLFFKLNNFLLFIYKFVISIFMILVTFGFKNFKFFLNNFIYLYLTSVVLGGGLYLIKDEVEISSNGLIFTNSNLKLNLLIIILLIPLILFFYLLETRKLKNNYSNYYKVDLLYKNNLYKFTAFLDTGNKLKDQYKNRPIILVYTDKINFSYEEVIFVPFKTASGNGVLKCLVVDKIIIDDKHVINNPIIGLSKENFNIDGIDMILNNETL